jgi:hypothetical protein
MISPLLDINGFAIIREANARNYDVKTSIYAHLHELIWVWDHEYKPNKDWENFEKEMIDAFLLIGAYLENNNKADKVNERIKRFVEKRWGERNE